MVFLLPRGADDDLVLGGDPGEAREPVVHVAGDELHVLGREVAERVGAFEEVGDLQEVEAPRAISSAVIWLTMTS